MNCLNPLRRLVSRSVWLALLLSLLLSLPVGVSFAQESAEPVAAPSPLELTAVDVQPEDPTPETLCKLSVTLANESDRPISALRFAVKVNGHDVPVYDKQVFLDVVPPGGEVTVPLYNFWVTETGRPAPAKGPLAVEVEVTDARWTKMEMKPAEPAKAGADETELAMIETWTLLDSLEALPEAVTVTRTLRRP